MRATRRALGMCLLLLWIASLSFAQVPELLEKGDYPAALKLLQTQLKEAKSTDDKALILGEIAKIQFDYLHDYEAVLDTCKRVLELQRQGLSPEDRLLTQFQMAKAYTRLGKLDRAFDAYEKILKENAPGSLSYRMADRAIHTLRTAQNRLKEQQRWLEQYRGTPLEIEIQMQMAELLLKDLNQPEKAVELFQQITTQHPNSAFAVDAQWRIAYAYHKVLNDPGRALEHYRVLRNRYPLSRYGAEAEYQIARIDAAQGRLRQAIQGFQHLIAHYPSFWRVPAAHYWLADTYERNGDYLKAMEQWRRFLYVYLPDMEPASFGEIGRYGESKVKIEADLEERIHRLETELPRALLKRAEAQEKAKDYLGAVQSYETLLATAPQSESAAEVQKRLKTLRYRAEIQQIQSQLERIEEPRQVVSALYRMAEIYEQSLNEPDRAIALYQQITTKGLPSWAARAAYRIGMIYAKQPLKKQALLAYQHVIRDYPESPEAILANYQLAELYRAQQDYQQALDAYRNTFNYPDREWYLGEGTRYSVVEMAHFRIGRTLYENFHNYPEALRTFQEFVKTYPNSPRLAAAYVMIGLIQELRQKPKEARQAYEKARDLAFSSEIQARFVVDEVPDLDFPGRDPLNVGKRLQAKIQGLGSE